MKKAIFCTLLLYLSTHYSFSAWADVIVDWGPPPQPTFTHIHEAIDYVIAEGINDVTLICETGVYDEEESRLCPTVTIQSETGNYQDVVIKPKTLDNWYSQSYAWLYRAGSGIRVNLKNVTVFLDMSNVTTTGITSDDNVHLIGQSPLANYQGLSGDFIGCYFKLNNDGLDSDFNALRTLNFPYNYHKFYKCTFRHFRNSANTKGSPIVLKYGTPGTDVQNCIFEDNYYVSLGSQYDYNCYYNNDTTPSPNTHDIVDDPVFINYDDADLQAYSPCIDEGIVIIDFVENFSCNAPDMGAYEYYDGDCDGVHDDGDICPNTPNGPNYGTCVMDVSGVMVSYRIGDPPAAVTCVDDSDCLTPRGFCQMSQGDYNSNGIGDACEGYADFDGTGEVNLADLLELILCYGTTDLDTHPECQDYDINEDERVSAWDFLILLLQYGGDDYESCP